MIPLLLIVQGQIQMEIDEQFPPQDDIQPPQINTDGGSVRSGNVHIGGRDFVGRDKIIRISSVEISQLVIWTILTLLVISVGIIGYVVWHNLGWP